MTEYARKHQHVSTIETSPSQTLLHHATNTGTGYIGYCTLRNGMPVHEIPSQTIKVRCVIIIVNIVCLLYVTTVNTQTLNTCITVASFIISYGYILKIQKI